MRFHYPLVCSFGLAVTPMAWAQPLAMQLSPTHISASSLAGSTDRMSSPAAVVDGDDWLLQRQATLGQSLEALPGVRASGFGAGASRPMIRGLDGARVKVLSDGADVLDASSISPDHGISQEPMLLERVEVLKGPATLLYGGGAIGGVVNLIDKKVPTYVPEKGYEGELEWRGNTAANDSTGLFGLTLGSGAFALRAEGLKRNADDYEIAGAAGEHRSDKQEGAYHDSDYAALGASWIGERGYLGLAYSELNSQYGLLAHEHADCHTHGHHWHCGGHGHGHGGHAHAHDDEGTPYIDMQQRRWDVRGELSDPLPGFESARLRLGHSDYRHDEIEAGELTTRFTNKASEARLELTHLPLAGWRGVLGMQTGRRDFAALGEEAYVPPTLGHSHALFVLEEYSVGDWRYELGWRYDWQDIEAEGQTQRHNGTSVSAATNWQFAPGYLLGLSMSHSQRLPSAEELYAYGPHAATRTVEIGNPDLAKERSRNLEVSLRKVEGRSTFELSVFDNHISDYIFAADTEESPGADYRVVEYRQLDARLRGAEGVWRYQWSDSLVLSLFGDHVQGKLRQGGYLPRMPGDRLGVRLNKAFTAALSAQMEFYRVHKQTDLAYHEQPTAGYNMLGASVSYQGQWGDSDYQVYLRGDNLLDVVAREHTSFIKDEVQLPGRNLTAGVRFTF